MDTSVLLVTHGMTSTLTGEIIPSYALSTHKTLDDAKLACERMAERWCEGWMFEIFLYGTLCRAGIAKNHIVEWVT